MPPHPACLQDSIQTHQLGTEVFHDLVPNDGSGLIADICIHSRYTMGVTRMLKNNTECSEKKVKEAPR